MAVLGAAVGCIRSPAPLPPSATPLERVTAHTSFLADPALEGRWPGTRGHERAAAYIEDQLRAIGLEPAFVDDHGAPTYRQWFRIGQDGPTVANIAGVIPGRGELAERYIVLGAHYDHIGRGEKPRMTRDRSRVGEVHPGADDNASGVAAVLLAARSRVALERAAGYVGEPQPDALTAQTRSARNPGRHSVLVAFFTAEEQGLVGSRHLLRASAYDTTNIDAMINLDMVGRLDEDATLHIWGTGTALGGTWSIITELFRAQGFDVVTEPSGWGPSDYASFTDAGIPAIHLITLNNDDYHTPDDTFDRLNLDGVARIGSLLHIAVSYLGAVMPLEFAETARMPHPLEAHDAPARERARLERPGGRETLPPVAPAPRPALIPVDR